MTTNTIDVLDDTHPVTAGLATGLHVIVTPAQDLVVAGSVAPGAEVLAEADNGGAPLPTLSVLDAGDMLLGGGGAAGRRVILPWGSSAFDINSLTADGVTIMRQSIEWAARLGPGACCLPSGACIDGLVTDCSGVGGEYQGDGTDCGSVLCPQGPPGACCFDDASCSFTDELNCIAAGGTFHGTGVTCGSITCPTGFIDTIAGTGVATYSGDGGPAVNAAVNAPDGVAIDSAGNIYIADSLNHRIRRISAATGNISTVAGTGTAGFFGNNGPATSAQLDSPEDVFVDASDNIYVADRNNNRIRRIDAGTGIITSVAGNGGSSYSGDGGLATQASLRKPQGVYVDGAGNITIADTDNQRVRYVNAGTGIITTIAGTGSGGYNGDGVQATTAKLNKPEDVFRDAAGNLFIADRLNSRVRRVDGAGIITTIAGTGTGGYSGDGGQATAAKINRPVAVAVTAFGDLLIADMNNHRIRRVDLTSGIIETVAGNGTPGFGGDGGPATDANLQAPQGVAAFPSGDIVIGDTANHRLREADLGAD
ncbi:MAG: hypothetical protein GY715_20490 [Planctomycetes bacterium]|nr:hypothetical protein [Planctomycetota bacterium]